MAVENIILAREGFSEINKLCKYLASLIVKNDAEANDYETEYSFNNYCKYEASYTGAKSIYLYSYTYNDLERFFSADYIHNKNLMDPNVINDLINKNDSKAIAFVQDLETKFISRYTEYNQYYRQFMGIPLDSSDKLYVENIDSDNPDDLIDITKRTLDKYPKTYEYWFVKRNIDILIEEHPDLIYLKFIEAPISPYRLRKLPDYSILYSHDGLLDEDELLRFRKAYNKARIYVTEQLYVTGQAKRYPLYGNLTLLLILYYTVCNYFNAKLEDYSLRRYTRYDIYDILESNGLSNLTKISDLNLLRKIVLNLDELNQYKGTEYALEQIFNLLDDKTITVKRFNLVKEFRTNNEGVLDIDTEKMYINSVGLKLKEVPIIMDKTNTLDSKNLKYLDYDERTNQDNLWGGIDKYTDDALKSKLKKQLKRDIIKMDFEEVRTKYLSISKAMNIYEKSSDTINMLYLTMKYYYDYFKSEGNPFTDYELNFQGMTTTPIALFGGICYLTNIINEVEDPWKISPDRNFLFSVFLLRTGSGLNEQIKDIVDTEIDIGNPILKTTIGEILGGKNQVKQYITNFNLNQYSTLTDVFEEYEKNKEIVQNIKDILAKENNPQLYYTFKQLENYNKSVFDFSFMFEGESDMREYLKIKAPQILGYIENLNQNVDEENYLLTYGTALNAMILKFEDFMNILLKDVNFFSFDSSREDTRYLEDLRILMNEYISIFSELYSVEQVMVLEDAPNNIIKTLFASIGTIFKQDMFVKQDLKWVSRKRKLKDIKKFFIDLKEVVHRKIKDYKKDNVEIIFKLNRMRSYFTVSDKAVIESKESIKKYKDMYKENINTKFKLVDIKITE